MRDHLFPKFTVAQRPVPGRRRRPPLVAALILGAGVAACTSTPSTAGAARPSRNPSSSSASGSFAPSTAASPASGAACLVGTWRVTRSFYRGGLLLSMTGGSQVNTFRANGTGTFVRTRLMLSGKIPGGTRDIMATGTGTFTYHVSGSEILYPTMNAPGTVVTKDNGVTVSTQHIQIANTSPDYFACSGNTLTFNDPDGTTVFARVP